MVVIVPLQPLFGRIFVVAALHAQVLLRELTPVLGLVLSERLFAKNAFFSDGHRDGGQNLIFQSHRVGIRVAAEQDKSIDNSQVGFSDLELDLRFHHRLADNLACVVMNGFFGQV